MNSPMSSTGFPPIPGAPAGGRSPTCPRPRSTPSPTSRAPQPPPRVEAYTLVKHPTEFQIAQLVTSGLSNKEVAAQCWISPRTVAFHLRNVFAKAGVTSGGELAQLDLG